MWQPRNCDDSSEPQLVPRSFSSSPFQWLPHSLFNTSFHCSCWVCGICNNPAGFFVSLNVNTMFKFILPNYDVVNHKVAVSTPSFNLRYLHDIGKSSFHGLVSSELFACFNAWRQHNVNFPQEGSSSREKLVLTA